LLETLDEAVNVLSILGKGSAGLIVDPLSVVATLNSLLLFPDIGSEIDALCFSGVSGTARVGPLDVLTGSGCDGFSLWRCKTLEKIDRFSAGAMLDLLSYSARLPGVGLEPRRPRALVALVELIGVVLRGVLVTSGTLLRDESLLVIGL
jgi:hypothetical protein